MPFFSPMEWLKEQRGIRCLCAIFLLFVIIPLFVPFMPKMPAAGLDPSWALGLNQAVAQGLLFGRDIIFTLGPYSAIYTKFYHPATDGLMVGGSFYLACSYWFALILLNKKNDLKWMLFLTLFLLIGVYAKDSLFFSYPLLAGLVVFRHCQLVPHRSVTSSLVLMFIFSPLGLLPLIKGSLLILCGVTSFLCVLYLAHHRRYGGALIAVLLPFVSLYIFWLLAGQSLMTLIVYINTSLILAFSFTEAMSTASNNVEALIYLCVSCLILYTLMIDRLPKERFFLGVLFFAFLFLSFKAGFVRHFGHALIPGTSIVLAALLMPYCIRSQQVMPIIVLALGTSLYIEGHYTPIAFIKNIQSTYSAAWYGLAHRINDKHWLQNNFNLSLNYLGATNSLPLVAGTTDIYSYQQTDLIASGNTWQPRPVFQSYSVFNDALAKKNQQHLMGANRPDTIFFKLQPIDNRLPSLEEGGSWITLLEYYEPSFWARDFLVLHKRDIKKRLQVSKTAQHVYKLGQTVHLPPTDSLIYVELAITPTFWGTINTFLFKPQELEIVIVLKDLRQRRYRMIAAMAKSGFFLSPFIARTEDIPALYRVDPFASKNILSFTIQPQDPGITGQWQAQYKARFKFISLNKI